MKISQISQLIKSITAQDFAFHKNLMTYLRKPFLSFFRISNRISK